MLWICWKKNDSWWWQTSTLHLVGFISHGYALIRFRSVHIISRIEQNKAILLIVGTISYFLQDLVKSHLMFAVREEVEVLKEKISELMERITQLEYENSILRANASQETLAQLQKSTQHPSSNVNEGHQGFS